MNTVWRVATVLAVIALVVVIARFIYKEDDSAKTVTKLYVVKKGNVERVVYGTGFLASAERAEMKSEIEGKIKKIHVTEGQEVEKGTLLAELINDDIDNEVKVQEAAAEKLKKELDELNKPIEEQTDVMSAKLAWDQAKSDYDAKKKDLDLEEENIRDGRPLKYSDDELKRLRGEVGRLEKKVELAERKYDDSIPTDADRKEAEGKHEAAVEKLSELRETAAGREMKSPIAGTVLRVLIDEENLEVDPDQEFSEETPFFVIADLTSVMVKGTVFQSDINKLEEGQAVRVYLDPLSKVFHEAELTKVPLSSGAGGEMGKFEVRIEFDIPPKDVKMGLTVNFQIVVEGKEGVLIVPVEFIKRDRGRKFVMIREGKVDEEREVKLGISDDHHYHVIDGLKEGEQVVFKVQSGD